MPKKAKAESQAEQSARFQAEAERMIAAGELNPDDAQATMDRLIGGLKKSRRPGEGGDG